MLQLESASALAPDIPFVKVDCTTQKGSARYCNLTRRPLPGIQCQWLSDSEDVLSSPSILMSKAPAGQVCERIHGRSQRRGPRQLCSELSGVCRGTLSLTAIALLTRVHPWKRSNRIAATKSALFWAAAQALFSMWQHSAVAQVAGVC